MLKIFKKQYIKIIVVNLGVLSLAIFLLNIYFLSYDSKYYSPIFITDSSENLRYVLKPKSVVSVGGVKYRINSLGFRDKEYPLHKIKGHYRILCVGDSFTFGQGVQINKTYPKILEKELQNKYSKDIEVINTGVQGYNTYDEFWYIKNKLIKLNPDLIVLGFYIGNDPEDPSIPFNNRMIIKHNAMPLLNYISQNNNNKKLQREDYWPNYIASIWKSSGPQWERCVSAIRGIKDITIQNNAKLLILIFPVIASNPKEFLSYHDQLIEVLNKFDIQYVDTLPGLIKSKSVYLSGREGHPNAKMHKIYAQVLLEELEKKRINLK